MVDRGTQRIKHGADGEPQTVTVWWCQWCGYTEYEPKQ
jgi:rubrerythrin